MAWSSLHGCISLVYGALGFMSSLDDFDDLVDS
jgi:hypothetical protein